MSKGCKGIAEEARGCALDLDLTMSTENVEISKLIAPVKLLVQAGRRRASIALAALRDARLNQW